MCIDGVDASGTPEAFNSVDAPFYKTRDIRDMFSAYSRRSGITKSFLDATVFGVKTFSADLSSKDVLFSDLLPHSSEWDLVSDSLVRRSANGRFTVAADPLAIKRRSLLCK